mmetsp:Transcript_16160/g.24378  ORF Transcript_16160/g.24378 Transcript_16160/m.24378 type:complete len:151 (+) Transcript_16160:44-496(+)
MGKKNQRRKSVSKQTRSQIKKKKRKLAAPSLNFGHESIRAHWNPKETLRQNYKRLGLAFSVDAAVKAAKDKEEKKGIISKELNEVQSLPKPAKYVPKSMPIDEQRRLIKLLSKHGEDYKKMARDIKINVYQQTEGELKKRIALFKHLQSM